MADPVFVDTSAILALLVPTDAAHRRAAGAFELLASAQTPLVTSSYVIVETYALLLRRLGLASVRAFRESFAPLLDIVWIDAVLHDRGLDLLLSKARRKLSLVDAVSFVVARERRIERVFAYDDDFVREGFSPVA